MSNRQIYSFINHLFNRNRCILSSLWLYSSVSLSTQQTNRRWHNVVTTPKLSVRWKWKFRQRQIATLWQRSNVTLQQRCGNVVLIVTTLQSRNFTKCLKTFQRYVKVVSANILIFLYGNNIHTLNCVITVKKWVFSYMEVKQTDLNTKLSISD